MGEKRITAGAGSGARTGLEPGSVLHDTYRILRPLAVGGMGEVYLAAHERLPGRLALKVLQPDLRHDETVLMRFRAEAEIMSSFRHPNIVHVFDFNTTPDGRPYLVMELVEGSDLGGILKRSRPLPPARVARIVRQIAGALETAHARGIVHRDLKPDNVMVFSPNGHDDFVKVVDFGISKTRGCHHITEDATILGTPAFMSPEQAQGRRDQIDHRSDQFALASMAYALLTGREPFRGDSAVTVLYQVVHQDAAPLWEQVRWPCQRVDAILRRGMAKDRKARFSGVLAFARALADAVVEDLRAHTAARATRPTEPRIVTVGSAPMVGPMDAGLETVRLRRKGPLPRRPDRALPVAARVIGLGAAAVFVYAMVSAPDLRRMTSIFGTAYRQATAATARTLSRWRVAGTAEAVLPAARSGPRIVPLPLPRPPEAAAVSR